VILNKAKPKYLSKGMSSRNNHSTGHEWDLKTGLGLTKISCLLIILRIRLGFSNTRGGFGSVLALV